MAGWGPVKIG